jgi:hypothetical protein
MQFRLLQTIFRDVPSKRERGSKMRNLAISIGAALALLAVVASGALAGKSPAPVAFTGSYSGTATTQQSDQTVTINANGTGSGTLIGAGKVTGTGVGSTASQPCVPFTGPGSLSGAGGSIAFKVVPGSQGCGDQQGQSFTVSGKAAVTSATGKLAGRKGLLRFSGTYDRSSGAFSVKFRGSLTK